MSDTPQTAAGRRNAKRLQLALAEGLTIGGAPASTWLADLVAAEQEAAAPVAALREAHIVWLADTDGRHVHAYAVHSTLHPLTAAPGSVAGVSLCGNGWRHTESKVSEAYGACQDCRAALAATAPAAEAHDFLAAKDRSMAEHDRSDCPNCGEWRDGPRTTVTR